MSYVLYLKLASKMETLLYSMSGNGTTVQSFNVNVDRSTTPIMARNDTGVQLNISKGTENIIVQNVERKM